MYEKAFQTPPATWGLRGDPFLWEALGWQMFGIEQRELPIDANPERFMAEVETQLCTLSGGRELLDGNDVRLDWLPAGGMSARTASGVTWRDAIIPELRARAERIASDRGATVIMHPAENAFRFAAWCASSAAGTSPLCRFKVSVGADLIRTSKLRWLTLGLSWLPEKRDFDQRHDEWCKELLQKAKDERFGQRITGTFSYGVAAKMVNVFLKSLFVMQMGQPSFSSGRVSDQQSPYEDLLPAIHPPVDRPLLEALQRANVGGHRDKWRQLKLGGWSKFGREEYLEAIDLIKEVTADEPWNIERFWPGYQ